MEKKREKDATLTEENREESRKLKALYEGARHGLTQAAFGERYGIGNQGAVWQCLNGKGMPISLKAAMGFARGLNCDIRDFSPRLAEAAKSISVSVSFRDGHQVEAHQIADALGLNSPETAELATPAGNKPEELVLHHYDTGGSMGRGMVLKDQPGSINSWNVSREWLQKNVPYFTAVENLAIVTGFGDSMVGMFNPGDPILVDRGITKADVDGVYFFRVGDEGFIKRLQRIPGQGILVISENPKYRDWTITPDMDFQVMAKVLIAWNGQSL